MKLEQLEAAVDAAVAGTPADGLAVGVTVEETTVLRCAGEVAGEPVGAGSILYGGSVSKQMIAFLLAQAVEAGLTVEEDRVVRWLPDLPDWMRDIRLRHLLHHTSDLPDVASPQLGVPQSNDQLIERFHRLEQPPAIHPGARFSYNNAGYVLLAEAVARLFGRPIDQLAGKRLFDPLGMTVTRLGGGPRRVPHQPDPPGTLGDGGLWTSVADLTTWLAAMNRGVLGDAAVRRAETPGRLNDGTPLDYAWGIRIGTTSHGPRITHGGTWASWLAKTVRVPDRQIAVAVLSAGSTEYEISELGIDLAALAAR